MKLAIAAYVLVIAILSVHFYQSPYWTMDLLQYMGNARLHETTDPVVLHKRVYGELRSSVPPSIFDLLTGAPGVQDDHGAKHDRFLNAYHYAEFLPFFAIRPLYNLTLYGISRTGIGLVSTVRLVSAGSYALLGILVLVWLRPYTWLAPALALLIMLIPHITFLARNTGADSGSVLLSMLALYLIFEKGLVAAGIAVLSSAIWFRTDNVVLLIPVLAVLLLQRRIERWKAAVLAALGVASVFVINRAAGDYGIQMLYYRNFVGIPIAPGEMTVHFTIAQYARVLMGGYKVMLYSFVPVFLMFGLIGLNRKTAPLLGIGASYAILHYIILPNWVDRWMGVFYLLTAMTTAFRVWPRPTLSPKQFAVRVRAQGLSVVSSSSWRSSP